MSRCGQNEKTHIKNNVDTSVAFENRTLLTFFLLDESASRYSEWIALGRRDVQTPRSLTVYRILPIIIIFEGGLYLLANYFEQVVDVVK